MRFAATASMTAPAMALLLLAGCSGDSPGSAAPPQSTTVPTSASASATASTSKSSTTRARRGVPRVRLAGTLATGLDVPWGLVFLKNGSALVAERNTGVVKLVRAGTPASTAATLAGVQSQGEGGLLGLAVAPGEAQVFAYFTSTEGDNRVVRMSFDGSRLGTPTTILTGIPQAQNHNGGRMAIGPDGNLYIGTGDASDGANAQDRENLAGKILRVALDGSVPAGNPFKGSLVWSYGHRNVQGLAFDSAGRLWSTEFGQRTVDELNLVGKGGNHGWPQIEGKAGKGQSTPSHYVDPKVVWDVAEASPSGLAIVDDVAYMAALRGERLWQIPLAGGRAGRPQALFTSEFGRLRTVEAAPDGSLWVATSNRDGRGPTPTEQDDRVLRLTLS